MLVKENDVLYMLMAFLSPHFLSELIDKQYYMYVYIE